MLGIVLAACLLAWANTRWGVGLRGDSFAYISGARNLAAGLGYSRVSGGGEVKPITHFPPLLSVALAVLQVAGVDAIPAARVLVIVLLGVNTALVGAMGWRIAGRPWAGIVAALLFGLNPMMIDLHSWAMAEPLFLTLTLSMLWALPSGPGPARTRQATFAGFLAGLSFLARYVGAAGILAGAAALLASSGARRTRVRAVVAFLGASLVPVGAWVGRNLWVSGTTTNRVLVWHPIETLRLGEAAETLSAWLLPESLVSSQTWWPWFGGVLGAACLIVAAILIVRKSDDVRPTPGDALLARALAWFVLAYAGVLAGNLLLLDSSTPLDARILCPAFAALTPLVGTAAAHGCARGRLPARLASMFLVLAVLAGFAFDARPLLDQGWLRGWGFSHRAWQSSALLQAVRDLPPITLYANEPDLLYFQTGRPSYIVFAATDPVTGLRREGYDEWLQQAQEQLAGGGAALVLFKLEDLMADPADREMVESLSKGLELVGRYDDGVILMARGLP